MLVDGAHAPGMVPLDLETLTAAYYTGNCHKWLCAPKGAAFLSVRSDRRSQVRPVVISHGANAPLDERSRFHQEFDWAGTADPTPWLCVPEALRVMGSIADGGWPGLMAANHELVLNGRRMLVDALGIPEPAPPAMIGSIATVPLPAGPGRPPGALRPTRCRIICGPITALRCRSWRGPVLPIVRCESQPSVTTSPPTMRP